MNPFKIGSANFWVHVAIAVALLVFAVVGVGFGAKHLKHANADADPARPLTEKMVEAARSGTDRRANLVQICTDPKYYGLLLLSEREACAPFFRQICTDPDFYSALTSSERHKCAAAFPETERREVSAAPSVMAPKYKRFGGPGDD
jgi:hypothetical protein